MSDQQLTIDTLPDEILESILQRLDWIDRQSAMLVCRRWSSVGFGTGSAVVLKIFMSEGAQRKYDEFVSNLQEMFQVLLLSQRRYKNAILIWDSDRKNQQMVSSILKQFGPYVESLKMHSCGSYTKLEWMSETIKFFPNLKQLDVLGVFIDDDFDDANAPKHVELEPMKNLRILYDKEQFVGFVRNASEVFANLTELYVKVTTEVPLTDLLRTLGPRLNVLTLFTPPNLFHLFSDLDFPQLESFEVHCIDERVETSVEHLGRFVANIPQLKILKIHARVDTSVLKFFEPLNKTLEVLLIYVDTLDFGTLEMIGHFKNLKQLWLQVASFLTTKGSPPILPSICSVKIECLDNVNICKEFYRESFPNLTDLELQFEDPDEHFAAVVSQIATLRRLIIRNPWYNAELAPFLEFCSKVKVLELYVYFCMLDKKVWDSSKAVPKTNYLQKLYICATRIDPTVYVPMMEAMPALRKLELAIKTACENDILQTLLVKFPCCDIIRKRKPENFFMSDMM